MKIFAAIMLVFSTVIFAEASPFYVTEQEPTNSTPFVPSEVEIEKAKNARESRPAEDDSAGNWGAPTEGFQLSIRLAKNQFTKGEPITVTVLLRNVTNKRLRYECDTTRNVALYITATRSGRKLFRHDEATPEMTFQEKLRYVKNGIGWTSILEPGTQRMFVEELTNDFDLFTDGEYKIQAIQQVNTLASINITNRTELNGAIARKIQLQTNVVSGIATFYLKRS